MPVRPTAELQEEEQVNHLLLMTHSPENKLHPSSHKAKIINIPLPRIQT